jgi:hypothetical protein
MDYEVAGYPACGTCADAQGPPNSLALYRLCLGGRPEHHNRLVDVRACRACKGIGEDKPDALGASRPDLVFPLPEPTGEFRYTSRPDGSILYEKLGWELPASIAGYQRDEVNKWLFRPLWPICATREPRAFIRGSCGCVQVEMRCDGKLASLTDCRLCRHV